MQNDASNRKQANEKDKLPVIEDHSSIEELTKAAPSKSLQIEIPKIELPRGGGAISSIDEKFQVNPSNGTASFSIPLPLSPGRNGFTPNLGLSYNSGAGNSCLGLGWSLSFADISRKTNRGIPRYRDESDTFLLYGGEDLVPFLKEATPGNWEKDVLHADGLIITRYRPRVTSDLSRIERIEHPVKGTYWRSTSADNLVTIFGRNPSTRITDPEDESKIFKWLPEFRYDQKGNWILFEYKSEDLSNVSGTIDEKNRLSGEQKFANKYLKRVKYGNRSAWYPGLNEVYDPTLPADQSCLFEFIVDYGEHDQTNPLPSENPGQQWEVRPDPFSSYRSGFEIRTYRLAKRMLMFHHFPGEVQRDDSTFGDNYLVKSLVLEHSASSFNQSGQSEMSYLTQITQKGYVKKPDGSYSERALPPMEFNYQQLQWDHTIHQTGRNEIENLPNGIGGNYRWIDLKGEGIPGILYEQETAWFYKPALGNVQNKEQIAFEAVNAVDPKPSFSGLTNGVLNIVDLDADGKKELLINAGGLQGYFEEEEGSWRNFQPFEARVILDQNDPNIKSFDITGDGKADIVFTGERVITFYRSKGRAGYAEHESALKALNEEEGPALVFSDSENSIFLADMTGDGLTDIVRIENGRVGYWANKGYGNYSHKITMDNAPLFDLPDQFNSQHIHIADITGSGTSDIIYMGKNKFQAYLNLGGNGFSEAHEIEPFFPVDNMTNFQVTDLLGNGTSCLVWSSSLPGDDPNILRYIDLMEGKKPHVLTSYSNNMGKKTFLEYKSSTWYYLTDKLAGKPWITKLAFPVQVISKTIMEEAVTNVRFTSEYKYHHGYYDHAEREFRGFGMVEQIDSEHYTIWKDENKDNLLEKSEDLFQPPVLTKTWFHTGAFIQKEKILNLYKSEYWQNNYEAQFPGELGTLNEPELADARILAAENILDPAIMGGLSVEEHREAVRSCKGMTLRVEIFARDAPETNPSDEEIRKQLTPYSVSSHNCHVILQQPRGENKHAVFQVLESEAFTVQYEKDITDPRISHKLNIKVDRYGKVLESATIAYPREQPDMTLNAKVRDAQSQTHITYNNNFYTNDVISPEDYRLRVLCENQTWEITALPKSGKFYTIADFSNVLTTATNEISYETNSDGTNPQRRKIEHIHHLFYRNDLTGPLNPGVLESMGIKFESYQLAFTPNMINNLFGNKIADANFPETAGNFVHFKGDSNWWVPSGFSGYLNPGDTITAVQSRFYTPQYFTNPLGNTTSIEYFKNYHYFIAKITDPLSNETLVDRFNFRTLSAEISRDLNENISGVIYDELGFVKALAAFGKDLDKDGVAELEPADNLSGLNEWTDTEETLISTYFQENDSNVIEQTASTLLQQASARFVYNLHNWIDLGKPVVASSILREKHHAHLGVGEESPLQIKFEYSEGLGNVAMAKSKAEPGPAKQLVVQPDLSYTVNTIDTTLLTPPQTRWLGNGRAVLNNKGNAVKQYEPYFSVSPAFENAAELVEQGVTPVLYYDSLSRNYRTEYPDGTYTEVKFGAWKKTIFDKNDNAVASNWHNHRINNLIDAELLAQGKDPDKEKTAAQKAAAHADTPTLIHFDTLGRTFSTVAHNKRTDNSDEFLESFISRDIEGNTRHVEDARNNLVVQFRHDMLGRRLSTISMDSGARWEFYNVMGKPVRTWDSRDHVVEIKYDSLQRIIEKKVLNGDGASPLNNVFEKIIYGEGQSNDKQHNLRGKTFAQYDTAGKIETPLFDFKGNTLRQIRKFTSDYKTLVDWQSPNTDAALESGNGYQTEFSYDGINRVIRKTCPDGSIVQNHYNESGLLTRVNVTRNGLSEEFVKSIKYNEKLQRKSIIYGNDVKTSYNYDKETFRLLSIASRRQNNELLQDLHYTYDASGNITEIEDKAIPTVFFGNQMIEPRNKYTYNAVYRLIEAEGKEHVGQLTHNVCDNWNDLPFIKNYSPGSDLEWRNYTQRYRYDEAGNITQMRHIATNGNWTRNYVYEANTNRLTSTSIGSQTYNYTHHPAHGYISAMPHLSGMQWNFRDELSMVSRQNTCTEIIGEATYYVYDGGGRRVRKVTENQVGNGGPTVKEERRYIGETEVYHKISGTFAGLERVSLHVSDDHGRIAIVDNRNNVNDGTDPRTVRYQLGDRSNSVALELNETAEVISYEEFHPYGTTAYQAVNSNIKAAAKRYKYTGMERDEESGLSYHNARYYLPWLGRWLSPDALGIKAGLNFYMYASDTPVNNVDYHGSQDMPPEYYPDPIYQLSRGFGALFEFNVGGRADPTVQEKPELPKGGVGGVAGGVLHTLTLRLTGILEDNPTEMSKAGMEAGASQVPFLDSAERLVTGETVTGRETSRAQAALDLTLETVPAVIEIRNMGRVSGMSRATREVDDAVSTQRHIGSGGGKVGPSETNPTCRGDLCVADVGAHHANRVRPEGTPPITNEEFVEAAGRQVSRVDNPLENTGQAASFLNQGFEGLQKAGRINQTLRASTPPGNNLLPGEYLVVLDGPMGGHAIHVNVTEEIIGRRFIHQGRVVSEDDALDLIDEGLKVHEQPVYRREFFDPQVGECIDPTGLQAQSFLRLN